MTYFWRKPKTWGAGEALTPPKLNTYISEQTNYLRYRNPVSVALTGTISMGSATIAAIHGDYDVQLDVQENEDILLEFKMLLQADTASRVVAFDIFVDNSYYLSSGLDTPLTRGVVQTQFNEAAQYAPVTYRKIIQGLTAGEHRFAIHGSRSAGTATILNLEYRLRGY